MSEYHQLRVSRIALHSMEITMSSAETGRRQNESRNSRYASSSLMHAKRSYIGLLMPPERPRQTGLREVPNALLLEVLTGFYQRSSTVLYGAEIFLLVAGCQYPHTSNNTPGIAARERANEQVEYCG